VRPAAVWDREMGSALVLLANVALGLSAGAVMAEGAVLIPSWRSLRPEAFLDWYRRHAALLFKFFGSLELVAAGLAILAALFAWLAGDAAARPLAFAALLAVLVLAVFPLYFQRANASFAEGTIDLADVGAELRRYTVWHWVRVAIAVAAFAMAVAGAQTR